MHRSLSLRQLSLALAVAFTVANPLAAQDAKTQPSTPEGQASGLAGATNVQSYGAVGDGETDDTDAIQKAINQGGSIYLPQGRYRITEPLQVNLEKLGATSIHGGGTATLIMAGPGPAINIVGTHDGTANPSTVAPPIWRQRSPQIIGLEITARHEKGDGIRLEGTFQPIISRLVIRQARHGIHLVQRNRNVIIESSHLYENSGVGIYLDAVNLHQINITGCHVSYNRGGGIVARGGQVRNLQINGCDIEGNMAPGDTAEPTANILLDVSESGTVREGAIVGCTIQHSDDAPDSANIRFRGRSDGPNDQVGRFSIADNAMSDAIYNIHLVQAQGVTLTGNTFWDASEFNLRVAESEQIVVDSNLFEFNPDYGEAPAPNRILFTDSLDCTLSDLHVQGSSADQPVVTLRDSAWMNVTGSVFADCAGGALWLDNVENSRVSDCSFRQPDNLALTIDGGADILVHDNLFQSVDISPEFSEDTSFDANREAR